MNSSIEKAIAFVSPSWALSRQRARMVGEMEREVWASSGSGGHRGGSSRRQDSSWGRNISYLGETSSERANKASRRDRARAAETENPIARTLLKTETDNIVADGFTLQIKSPDKSFNKYYEARWEEWLEAADVRGMRGAMDLQRMCYKSPRRDGDGLIHLVADGADGQVQYVPGDLICNPWGQVKSKNEKVKNVEILDGVEVDQAGRPVRFYVQTRRSGSFVGGVGMDDWQEIDAADGLYQVPEMDADLGVRGDSCYSTVFSYLDQVDQYADAVIIAARMAAVFGLIFKEASGQKQVQSLSTLTNIKGEQQRALTMENGSLKFIGQADDVVQVQAQQPMQQTPDFLRAMLRLIGMPFDMPLELIAKDMSTCNFASARIGLLGYYRACRARQRRFRDRCLNPMFLWWMGRQKLMQLAGHPRAGRIAIPDNWAGAEGIPYSMIARGWDYTDPVSEAKADFIQMQMGTKTRHMIASERGNDLDDILEEETVERMERRLRQLPDCAPTETRDRIELVSDKSAKEQAALDMEFKRKAWLGFQADGTVADVTANLTDLQQLTGDVGLPVNREYVDPYLPVQVDAGKDLVSGTTVVDPSGDVVGGGLVPATQAEPPPSQAPDTGTAGKENAPSSNDAGDAGGNDMGGGGSGD